MIVFPFYSIKIQKEFVVYEEISLIAYILTSIKSISR